MTEREAIEHIWNYHQMGHHLERAGIIWALGSHDLRVADRVAELWHAGMAPLVVMSGGLGNFTEGVFLKPEANLFAERAMELGVPEEVILIENLSTNTGENVSLTRKVLDQSDVKVLTAIAVQKPYMERRTYATIRAQWPELDVQVTSPQLDFEHYCNEEIPRDEVIAIMVGDLQRIIEYPKMGYMIEQNVPEEVHEAMRLLIGIGYDKHLLEGTSC
ncbi:YdcF family protein [Verrucomicrobiaceae bacterium N1E253]|uniref:YdcF family protein n=2 Tax=Oceaniferula marina TaxID=2748318 RepID=A0A851GRR2_9BACT|nr:YdcF family protein [Oceaniferula marina]